ncbi:PREDICTED: cytidine deaminase 1-like [Ipomoea nil]|uniref:cytidine deaminase 1-like n=1 Tax=Ipomoea nil TaxID=35883 RepID=UPI0009009556|nr:PREDICTED: cytidine deaminase 1-like [Ipomoea nil]XP_019151389.1 PREDICTED: cytidine deaminase 1-like [Ipomoea nil]XP_019151390.1 PREDICTED: cytidine deaminase 1-like [Ipomoea nil]
MDQPRFVIEAAEAESMAQSLALPSVRHLLPALVRPAQALARPPISNYHVAAVGLGSDGRVFVGVNLEFPGLPLHHSVHAEQFLVTSLKAHGCPRLLALAVSAAPCGHCRQFFQELRNSSAIQILVTSQNKQISDVTFKPLSQFLPNQFGPYDLLDDQTPLLLEPHHNALSLTPIISDDNRENHQNLSNCNGFSENDHHNLCNGFSNNSALLKAAAMEAANESHAPYTNCPSGMALMDCEGKVYKGSYAESAAYNPTLGPFQAALIAFVAGGGGGYDQIVAAALVEKEEAKVKQEDTARLLLKAVSPKCELKVFHCSSSTANFCKKAPN